MIRPNARFWSLAALAALALCATSACKKSEPDSNDRGPAPPPEATGKKGVCAKGGGESGDKLTAKMFPRVSDDYCIDPNGDTRAYGAEAERSLEQVCTEELDGECEVYKAYGLERVVTLRYVDGKGSPGTVSARLSRFKTETGAYGFFTLRVIADADPAQTKPKKLDAGTQAVIGGSNANIWRGKHVLELAYNNEREAPDALRTSTARVLPPMAKAVGEKLPGDPVLPPPAAKLPADDRIEMGVSYVTTDLLDVAGVGPGAIGFHQKGDKRWRVVSIVRGDEAAAKDVMKTLKKLDSAKEVKGVLFDALTLARRVDEDAPLIGWVFGQSGANVIGIGDEEHVLSADQSADEAAKLNLSDEEKLSRLKALVAPPSE